MELVSVFTQLDGPLNLAHVEDRKASTILSNNEKDFQAAIKCHQNAHAHLRMVLMQLSASDLLRAYAEDDARITSIYCQMEHHIIQQSVLLNKQRQEIIELKRKPYLATLRERATALALQQHTVNKDIQARLSEQESLLDSLKDKIEGPSASESVNDPSNASSTPPIGKKRPKDYRDTLEELQNLNDQLKSMINEVISENIRLKEEIQEVKNKRRPVNTLLDTSTTQPEHLTTATELSPPDSPKQTSGNNSDRHDSIYTLPQVFDLPPLEQPPEFDMEESTGSSSVQLLSTEDEDT